MTTRIRFSHNGEEIYEFNPAEGVQEHWIPPIGSFVRLINTHNNMDRLMKVQQITTIYEQPFVGPSALVDVEPLIEIHLRRLMPGELGNRDEPSGDGYDTEA